MEEVMGLLIFLLLGLATLLKGFQFVDQLENWSDAQSYCRDKFNDLATIESQDDWSSVREILANTGSDLVWLGLYDDALGWTWSLDNTSLYHTELGSWFDFEDDLSAYYCVAVYNGQLDDYSCQSTQRSVCYDEPSNSYVPVTQLMSWQSAQTYCRQSYTDLASIRDQQEFDDVMDQMDANVTYWIGLSREGWKWSDQSESSCRLWAPGEPRGFYRDCIAAGVDGWVTYGCGNKFPFICSAPQRKVLKVTLKTDGSVNLNDPLVQEAILKQMEHDLRGQGVTQEFSLRWKKQLHGDVFNKTEL